MVHLLKLEMKGFKSFANKTEIVFGKDFNVILGPNGSGKSNVLDALCFVLGKSSAKSMRAEKSANLIYNGGKTKKGAKEGEVSMYFDNTDRTFALDEDVVKLTRLIRATGQSIYKINERKHTRNEILEMLSAAKINPDGYNIILQGDIVRFVEMSSVERRQVLEEIAGISLYEEKKHKADNELQKVEGSLNDAKIILTERENFLKQLKKERDQALSYKDLQTNLDAHKATLIHLNLEKKQAQVAKIDDQLGGQQKKIDALQKDIDGAKAEVKTKKEDIEAINKDIEKRGEKEQVSLHKEIEALKVELITKKQRVTDLDQEVSRIKARSSQLEANKNDVNNKIKTLKEEVSLLQKKQSDNTKQTKEVQDKIAAFKKKFNLNDAADIDQAIEKIDQEVEGYAQQIQQLRVKQQDHIRNEDRLQIQIDNMDEKIDRVKDLQKEHKSELKALQQKKVEFKKATVELSAALTSDTSLNQQLATARQRVNKHREEEAKLQARSVSIQETLGADLAITEISRNNSLGEVHGTVASLASVDAKFGLALEVAAGNKMKGIVVGNDQVAAKAIKYLRENRLGVASFFPLNTIKSRPKDPALKALSTANGCYGFATDLIEFDTKYRSIFSFVFGSTLVVENIDVARRIGVGKAKMVTLEGDLVEKSGSMRGGFLKKKGRSMGFQEKQLSKNLTDLTSKIADAESLIASLESKKTDNEEKIMNLRDLKANLEGDIIKSEKSLHIDSQDLDVSQQLKKEFGEEIKKVKNESDKVQKEITGINTSLAKLKSQRQQLRDKITAMRNPTKLAELNSFEEHLAKLRGDALAHTGDIGNRQNQIDQMLLPEIENVDKIIKQHQKESKTFVDEQEQLKGAVLLLQKEVDAKEKEEEAFYKQFKQYFAKRNALQQDVEKKESGIIDMEEKIREFERKNNAVSLEGARIKAELAALQEEMEEFKGVELLKDVEDVQAIKRQVASLSAKLGAIGAVNMKALEVYEEVEAEYNKLLEKRDKLLEEKESIYEMINEIETRKRELFLRMFDIINTNFKKIFTTLSHKGEAFLELEEPENPFDAGVRIKVRLSGTKFMDIRSLSGGEKTMTALAFIFAIQENDPASFYIMDEVDAALDKRNAERLAELVNAYCDKAQYVVISHNDGVISAANNLYGVSMNEHGISKVVSLRV